MGTKTGDRNQVRIRIRRLTLRDLEEVMDIERHSFDCPWSYDDFTASKRRLSAHNKAIIIDNELVGYFIYTKHPIHIEINNFAIRWDYRCQGIGRQVIDFLIANLGKGALISMVVSEYNLDCQLFLKACGFKCIGVLKDHYEEVTADAYEFIYDNDYCWPEVSS